MHAVLLTPTFEKQAERAGLSDAEIQEIVSFLAANPMAGNVIKGSGGARKVRFARSGIGKSGGYRTIHYFAGEDVPLFLLGLIDKRKSANLSKEELNALSALLGRIAEAYRKGKKL